MSGTCAHTTHSSDDVTHDGVDRPCGRLSDCAGKNEMRYVEGDALQGENSTVFIADSQVHIWAAETPERPWRTGARNRPHRAQPFSKDDLLREMDTAIQDGEITRFQLM